MYYCYNDKKDVGQSDQKEPNIVNLCIGHRRLSKQIKYKNVKNNKINKKIDKKGNT